MSDLVVVRFDPVQEIAAEPATLDLLRDILRPKAAEPRATPELLDAARLTGWPLVYDEKIPPGYVHCRPTPGAPPPLAARPYATAAPANAHSRLVRHATPTSRPPPPLTAACAPAAACTTTSTRRRRMPDLHGWITQQIDEREQLAQLISPGGYAPDEWRTEPSRSGRCTQIVAYSRTTASPSWAARMLPRV